MTSLNGSNMQIAELRDRLKAKEWRIANLEDDLAELEDALAQKDAEIERLKALVQRLRWFAIEACEIADMRGSQISDNYPPMMCEEALEEAGLLPGDLEDADPAQEGV